MPNVDHYRLSYRQLELRGSLQQIRLTLIRQLHQLI